MIGSIPDSPVEGPKILFHEQYNALGKRNLPAVERIVTDRDIATPHRGPRGQHEGALRGCAERWQGAPLQGVLRRGRELEPRRARHRPRRGWRGRTRHTFRRHQSQEAQRPRALRGYLLPARPGRKSHQILENASGGGPHLLALGEHILDVTVAQSETKIESSACWPALCSALTVLRPGFETPG